MSKKKEVTSKTVASITKYACFCYNCLSDRKRNGYKHQATPHILTMDFASEHYKSAPVEEFAVLAYTVALFHC